MSDEEDNELTVLGQSNAVAVPDQSEVDDVIRLPGYDDITEQKVRKDTMDLFRMPEGAMDHGMADFQEMSKLATYADNTIGTIREMRRKTTAASLMTKAATLTRFWYLASTIDSVLKSSKVGSGAAEELAAAMGRSTTYVYRIRSIATKLTAKDCYLLGMRDLDTTHLRKLAQIHDDTIRRQIVRTCIETVRSSEDLAMMPEIKRQLVAAVNSAVKAGAIEESTSDPSADSSPQVTPEYDAARSAVRKLSGVLHKIAQRSYVSDFQARMGDFYLMDNVPGAEGYLDAFLEEVTELKSIIGNAVEAINDIKDELDCVSETQLTSSEEIA